MMFCIRFVSAVCSLDHVFLLEVIYKVHYFYTEICIHEKNTKLGDSTQVLPPNSIVICSKETPMDFSFLIIQIEIPFTQSLIYLLILSTFFECLLCASYQARTGDL